LEQAIVEGLAPDGGLYLPNRIPKLSKQFLTALPSKKYWQVAEGMLQPFMAEVSKQRLRRIVKEAFTFDVPMKQLEDDLYVVELFHGPTLSFKDFGARFFARLLQSFIEKEKTQVNIIVATSGDTGSAVASGFLDIPNIHVYMLYPQKRVSKLQEQQLTTYGHNITALEVLGKFDDCQKLAKTALAMRQSKSGAYLSSANSINLGRLLPQSVYYAYATAELKRQGVEEQPRFVVPSGNFGNLTGGLLAKRMGVPIAGFVAATNANNVVPSYLKTGRFKPRVSKATLSNAMDVGNPSNFSRMLALYQHKRSAMAKDIAGIAVSDAETIASITAIYKRYGYLVDPHTAVGIAAAKTYRRTHPEKGPLVVLSTAHPAKFKATVEAATHKRMKLPRALALVAKKKKKSVVVGNSIAEVMAVVR